MSIDRRDFLKFPIVGADHTTLNPKYFEYCDYIIRTAAKYRHYAMVFAMWGGAKAGTMNRYTARQLHTIGLRLGARLKRHDNVILVAGGESSPPHIAVPGMMPCGRWHRTRHRDGC